MADIQNSSREKKAVVLAADELAALRDGLRSEETERIYTLDEALEFARKQRQEWMKAKISATA